MKKYKAVKEGVVFHGKAIPKGDSFNAPDNSTSAKLFLRSKMISAENEKPAKNKDNKSDKPAEK